MSTNAVTATLTHTLTQRTEGLTSRKLAGLTNLGLRETNDALRAMEDAGTATRTADPATGNRKGTELWTLTTPTADTATDGATTPDTATDEATAPADDTAPVAIDEATVSIDDPTPETADEVPASAHDATTDAPEDVVAADAPVSGAPVSGAPTSGAPVGTADHLKIVMVAGVLGDHPDGVSASDVSGETGLRAAIVAKVLVAMETAGAAVRKPDDGGVEVWLRGEADLTQVSLINAPTFTECPTCGHRTRVRAGIGAVRVGSGVPGQNSDGSATLAKNALRNMVRDFLDAHYGHVFNAGTIARELGRSSGAVGNALAKLVVSGEATLVSEAPMRYSTALTTAPTTSTDTDTDSDSDSDSGEVAA